MRICDFHIYIIFICLQCFWKCFPTFFSHFVVTPTRSKVESWPHLSCFCCLLHRRLCHPHIVTFYGAVFRKVPRGLEAAFVSECPGVDLKYYLIDQPGNCPARNPTSTENAIRWADQVVEALMSIYSIFDGCVHGDLRLKNVLVGKYFICNKTFCFNWFNAEGKNNKFRNYQSADTNIALIRFPRSITRSKVKG